MSNQVYTIEHSQTRSGFSNAKNFVGKMAAQLLPSRAIEIYRNPQIQSGSYLDRAILFHLRQRSLKQNRQAFLERIHRNFWAGQGGTEFSGNCDHRFHDLFLKKQQEDFKALKQVWNSVDGKYIVELGTNSGLLLNYLTTNLDNVVGSVGIDINQEQIVRNNQSTQFDPRIQFHVADGAKWILENAKPNTLFVSNGGVLEYFRRERINEMLAHISQRNEGSVFFASEPVADDHDYSTMNESIPFGDELSFSHNYTDLFQSNGFNIVHQRPVTFDSWKLLTTIATSQT